MDHTQSWLTLLHAPGLQTATIDDLLLSFGDAGAILRAGRAALSGCGLSERTIAALLNPDRQQIDTDLAWLDQPGHALVARGDPHYPRLLAAAPGAPVALYVDGDPAYLLQPQIAIVGSRTPTETGRDNARAFAAYLAERGLTVTSGLAAGIDSAAHAGAVDKIGSTIAVCGTGLDQVYPASGDRLAARIRESGALISEFPPGTPPRRANFPQRNRIIAGLSIGTLVVEAAHRSGSLITAHHAIEYGREVFAIPGSIHNPLARGCHRLIREGAKLVESAGDILDELSPVFRVSIEPVEVAAVADSDAAGELDDEYGKLLDCIGFEPTQVDTMVQRSGLTPNAVSSMLLILELRGYVAAAAGGGFSRTSKRQTE